MPKHNFRKLNIWIQSMDLSEEIYNLTKYFPPEEKFGLIAQMRRSAVSIASNISEGCGRGTNAQFAHFLDISIGSAYELETQIILSHRLNMWHTDNYDIILSSIHQIQNGIISFQNTLIK